MKVNRLLTAVSALMLVLAACTDTAGDDGSTTTGASDTTVAGGGGDGDGGAAEGGTLDAVKEAGVIVCGVNESLPGFGIIDDQGNFSGFDVDLCRAVASGILGDAEAVEFFPLTAEARFPALQSGEIDVMIRNTTWTALRDGQEGATFLHTTFYDGQGMMVPADTGFTTMEDLANANICVLSGTTTELNLTAVFDARGIPFNPLVFEENTQLRPAYEEGQCEAWTSDASQLAANKTAIESEGGAEQFIMEEIFSKEPLGPVVRDGDSVFAQAVDWSIMATVQAWEFGIDSTNVEGFESEDPNIQNFLGAGTDAAAGLGLNADFAVQIISQVGNYEEIYNRHIPAIGLLLEGSLNDLWTNGGLQYVPPYR
jgi:general L-amino acid transport system substrate-binding protein